MVGFTLEIQVRLSLTQPSRVVHIVCEADLNARKCQHAQSLQVGLEDSAKPGLMSTCARVQRLFCSVNLLFHYDNRCACL